MMEAPESTHRKINQNTTMAMLRNYSKTYCSKAEYLFYCFITYAFIGWVYEVILGIIRGKGFINRGMLSGPWLPVYGVGGILLLLLFYERSKNWLPTTIFLVSAIFSTLIELAASYIIDAGGKSFTTFWNYSHMRFNFEGRIALWPSARFGIIAVIVLWILQPRLDRFYLRESRAKTFVCILLILIFLVDVIYRTVFS